MNVKQKAFAEAYAQTGNAAQSYVAAGYKASSASVAASCGKKLLMRPDIADEIKLIADRLTTDRIMKATDCQVWLTGIINNPDERTSDRLKAMDILCKTQGTYIQKLQVTAGAIFIRDELDDD